MSNQKTPRPSWSTGQLLTHPKGVCRALLPACRACAARSPLCLVLPFRPGRCGEESIKGSRLAWCPRTSSSLTPAPLDLPVFSTVVFLCPSRLWAEGPLCQIPFVSRLTPTSCPTSDRGDRPLAPLDQLPREDSNSDLAAPQPLLSPTCSAESTCEWPVPVLEPELSPSAAGLFHTISERRLKLSRQRSGSGP